MTGTTLDHALGLVPGVPLDVGADGRPAGAGRGSADAAVPGAVAAHVGASEGNTTPSPASCWPPDAARAGAAAVKAEASAAAIAADNKAVFLNASPLYFFTSPGRPGLRAVTRVYAWRETGVRKDRNLKESRKTPLPGRGSRAPASKRLWLSDAKKSAGAVALRRAARNLLIGPVRPAREVRASMFRDTSDAGRKLVYQMTPEQALRLLRKLQDDALAAEAAQLATGWRFLAIEGIAIECDADLELYEQVLTAFREAAYGMETRGVSTSSQLTLGIRGAAAAQRLAGLRVRLESLNPPDPCSGRRWQICDGAR